MIETATAASVAEKQYLSFDKVFNDGEKEEPIKIEKEEPLTTAESSLIYNNKYSFSEFKNVEKYENESLVSTYNNYLTQFKQRLKEVKNLLLE